MSSAILNASADLLTIGSSLEGMGTFLESWHQIALNILGDQNVHDAQEAAEINNQLHVLLESIPLKAAQLNALGGQVATVCRGMDHA